MKKAANYVLLAAFKLAYGGGALPEGKRTGNSDLWS